MSDGTDCFIFVMELMNQLALSPAREQYNLMKTHNKVQIIRQGNKLAFAVIPYEDYLELMGCDKGKNICTPHEVVEIQIKNKLSLIATWRAYKGLSQQQLADRLDTSQSAIAQYERTGSRAHPKTLKKVADALGINFLKIMK